MRYSLDANAISLILEHNREALLRLREARERGEILICPMAAFEVLRGLHEKGATRKLADFDKLLEECQWREFTREIWFEAARTWAELRGRGIGMEKKDADLLIARHARHFQATVVTKDRDFKHFTTSVEDWGSSGAAER
ncbi:MAG TPA: PIN domain-containing protein [Thermoanaerobaculia bacterium]|nr:PIN domain-containing protein [Thermoanaerobaculia bacterium]